MNSPKEFLFPPYKSDFKLEILGIIQEKTSDFAKSMFPAEELWDLAIAYSLAMSVKFNDMFEDSGCTAYSGMYKKKYGWTLPGLPYNFETSYTKEEFRERQFSHIIDETCSACSDLFSGFDEIHAQICSNSAHTFLEDLEISRKIANDYFIDGIPIVSDIRFTTQPERDTYAKEMRSHLESVFYAERNDLKHVRQEAIIWGCKKCLKNYEKLYSVFCDAGNADEFYQIQDAIIGDCCDAAMLLCPSFGDDDALKCKQAIDSLLKDKETATRIVATYYDRGKSFIEPVGALEPCKEECWEEMKPMMLKVQNKTKTYLSGSELQEIVCVYVCESILGCVCISCQDDSPETIQLYQDKTDHLVTEAGAAIMDRFPYFGEGDILLCKKQIDLMLKDPDRTKHLLYLYKESIR